MAKHSAAEMVSPTATTATVTPKRSASTGSLSPSVTGAGMRRMADIIIGRPTSTPSSTMTARPIISAITASTKAPMK